MQYVLSDIHGQYEKYCAMLAELDNTQLAALNEWIINGGGSTLRELKQMGQTEREDILEYIREMELYAEVTVGGRDFVLVHAGLDRFFSQKMQEDYELQDFLFCRPRFECSVL